MNPDDNVLDFDISDDAPLGRDLGAGNDTVVVSADEEVDEVRLTFTSAEVGNGDPNDSDASPKQDGGLAVRMATEDDAGAISGPTSRFDDEGIEFVSDGTFTFDVRDLNSGAQRGDDFTVVTLGTDASQRHDKAGQDETFYVNAGAGNDTVIGGTRSDFLVGGAGNDRLEGREGNDSFVGGGGNDKIIGSNGANVALFNVSTDGIDQVDLGAGADTVRVSAADEVDQVRLTFTSSEVGNGDTRDSDTSDRQDGGLAVRLSAETDGATAPQASRMDDEGVEYVSDGTFTFDVRDLVSGASRGDDFDVVSLGTQNSDRIDKDGEDEVYYVNGGAGNDTIRGGTQADFLVGGAGNDRLEGRQGDDAFIGGGGNDIIFGTGGENLAIANLSTDGVDQVNLGRGDDEVTFTAAAEVEQVRVTFTSSEVGNGNVNDSDGAAQQDGGLAVRLSVEDAAGNTAPQASRYDDEGIEFVSDGTFTFDVRDLTSGVARGDDFDVVSLGTDAADVKDESAEDRNYYVNAGAGDDSVAAGSGADFLVGGSGNDRLSGGAGEDDFIGGGGNDTLTGGAGADAFIFSGTTNDDTITDFASGADVIDLSAYGIAFEDLTISDTGPNARIDVDSNSDGTADFRITLANANAPVEGDFAF